jgi:hypothetical protein
MATTADRVARNGHLPQEPIVQKPVVPAPTSMPEDGPEAPLASLRMRPVNIHLFKGYGPLVVGLILFVLMVTLAPTVAPERIVQTPVNATTEEEAP